MSAQNKGVAGGNGSGTNFGPTIFLAVIWTLDQQISLVLKLFAHFQVF